MLAALPAPTAWQPLISPFPLNSLKKPTDTSSAKSVSRRTSCWKWHRRAPAGTTTPRNATSTRAWRSGNTGGLTPAAGSGTTPRWPARCWKAACTGPRPIDYDNDGSARGYSPSLGLELRSEDRQLRFWDPATREYLPDLIEALEALAAAEARAERAEEKVRQLREQLRRRQSRE